MATLQEAVDQLVDAAGVLTGIRTAPDEPPNSTVVFPAIITYSESGSYRHSPIGVMTGSHNVVMDLLVAHKDTPRDTTTLMGYAKSIPNAIFAAHKAGTLTAVEELGEITYRYAPMTYADQECLGFRFIIHGLKTQDSIT